MLPNFLIIGAGRSGTTTLYRWLQQHPQIFMSAVKEPHFFAHPQGKPHYRGPGGAALAAGLVTSRADYEALFEGRTTETAVGEASVEYLHNPAAPDQIRRYIPAAKLIAILRNPIDRGYSSYLRSRQSGREYLPTYIAAVEAEERRLAEGWSPLFGYRRNGLYWKYLSRYVARFPREQIKLYLFEDLRDRPLWLLQDVFAFLEVDPRFRSDISHRHNVSGASALPWIDRIARQEGTVKSALRQVIPRQGRAMLKQVWTANLRRPTTLPAETRERLLEYYRPDLIELQRNFEIDVSHWIDDSDAKTTPANAPTGTSAIGQNYLIMAVIASQNLPSLLDGW